MRTGPGGEGERPNGKPVCPHRQKGEGFHALRGGAGAGACPSHFEPPRTEPEHTVRRAFPEHGVFRIEDLPRVPYPLSPLAAQGLIVIRHSTPRRENPSGKKKRELSPPLSPPLRLCVLHYFAS